MRRICLIGLLFWGCDDEGSAEPDEDGGAVVDGATPDTGPEDAATDEDGAAPDAMAPGCPQAAPAGPTEIPTTRGLVRGRQEGNVLIFKGIPFALPPVGTLRWAAPQPPACLPPAGFDALEFGPECPQLDAQGQPTGDEDCLQLNVWAPAEGSGHAVMVFIHGGGNVQGSASTGVAGQNVYDGAGLANLFGVVVVTIQYRLGALGWLVRPPLTGNYGLLDQIAALGWVRENIGHFGGDPQKVMIFGESAGAVNVCALVASPLAAGLFYVSLMESGACILPVPAEVERAGREQADASGCMGPDEIECLHLKTPAQLLMDYPPVVGVASRGSTFQPYIDGVVLADQPEAVIRAGNHNRGTFVAGANSDETAQAVPEIADAAAYEAAIRAQFGVLANQVLEVYPVSDFDTPREALVAVTTDARFVCTTRRAVRAAAPHGPTYLYHFAQNLQNAPRLAPLGAYHGLELFFVFQNLDFAGYRPAADERLLAASMGGYWTRLAATGDPNDGDAPAWPLHQPGDRHLLLDGEALGAGDGLRAARCDFWDALIDSL